MLLIEFLKLHLNFYFEKVTKVLTVFYIFAKKIVVLEQ